jgi:hypothetical protein
VSWIFWCPGFSVARNDGEKDYENILSGLTNFNLWKSLFGNQSADGVAMPFRALAVENVMESIRVDLARAHYQALDSRFATSTNPVMLERQDIANFHYKVFMSHGAGDVFGGKFMDKIPGARFLYDWCPPPSCKP